MKLEEDSENQLMNERSPSPNLQIDPKRARFPCCIVWTPLPLISWLVPFIGHIGICREDGVILDFAGPNFVCVDNFAFGSVCRYLQISKEKCHALLDQSRQEDPERETVSTWDEALGKSTREFQHRPYNLFTCNCHSFVANGLNRLRFSSHSWNVVSVAALIFLRAKWVSTASLARSFLPFLVVLVVGLAFGGSKFLMFLAFFTFFLVGWFLFGTCCVKDLIRFNLVFCY